MALPLAWTNDKVQTIDEKKRWKPRQLVCLRDRLHARVMDINFNKDTFCVCVCWKNPFFLFSSNLEILFVSFFLNILANNMRVYPIVRVAFFIWLQSLMSPFRKKDSQLKEKN